MPCGFPSNNRRPLLTVPGAGSAPSRRATIPTIRPTLPSQAVHPITQRCKMSDESILSRRYFDNIYIPAGLIVGGALIMDRYWVWYSSAIALLLGIWKYYQLRTCCVVARIPLLLFSPILSYPICGAIRLTTTRKLCRVEQGPQARRLPGVRAQGEDGHLPQCSHVCLSPSSSPSSSYSPLSRLCPALEIDCALTQNPLLS